MCNNKKPQIFVHLKIWVRSIVGWVLQWLNQSSFSKEIWCRPASAIVHAQCIQSKLCVTFEPNWPSTHTHAQMYGNIHTVYTCIQYVHVHVRIYHVYCTYWNHKALCTYIHTYWAHKAICIIIHYRTHKAIHIYTSIGLTRLYIIYLLGSQGYNVYTYLLGL